MREPADISPTSSLDRALDICEALSGSPRGLSVKDLARAVRQPSSTVHRLLGRLMRRGYVRQDEDTARYSLTLKMLDVSYKMLGRSEIRLHAYPVLREHALATGQRAFLAVPSAGEVTYLWPTGPDEVSTYTSYGREMPGHCAQYFDPAQARRLSCLRLADTRPSGPAPLARLGRAPDVADPHRLLCVCAPVHDYTGREVARVGLFEHAADDGALERAHRPAVIGLAQRISMRLGHLPAASMAVGA
jgi:DNA-binding IclR family transcriptional regulator